MPVFFSKRYTTAALALIITSLALVWLASGPSNSDSFYKLKESVSTRIDTLRKAALAAYEPQRQNDQSSGQGSMPKASEPEAVREGQPDGKESPQSVSSWRTHLNLEHSASGEAAGQHSRSLHFSNIYVVQSPSSFNSGTSAQQRQDRIQQLANALGIDYTWVPCTDPQSDLVKWIAEQVDDVRSLKREALSEQMSVPSASIGGSATGNVWLHPARPLPNATATVPEAALSQTWLKQSRIKPSYGSLHFPPLHSEEFESLNWLEWMNALSTSSFRNRLRPSDENMHISSLLHDPIETDDSLQLSAESISEWHTHTQLWQRIAFNQEHSSLILSDDIDLEFDLERQWLNIKSFLPGQSSTLHSEWQSVFLGHSSTVEQTNPAFLHPLLHFATEPRGGLKAYALSNGGISELLDILSDPWVAYQSHLDIALTSLVRAGAIRAFSIDPPVAVSLLPDMLNPTIHAVTSYPALVDSTMRRIWSARDVSISNQSKQSQAVDRPRPEYRFKSPRPPSDVVKMRR